MPISNTKDVIPFVNDLENKIKVVDQNLQSWLQEKAKILAAIPQVERNRVSSISAIVKAEDALAEINTATYGVVAAKGQRLRKVLEDLKEQVLVIVQESSAAAVPEYLKNEIENAVSSVDQMVDDGLKLDYRLRQIQTKADKALTFMNRELIMPHKYTATMLTSEMIMMPAEEGVTFVDGDVTVLDATGDKGVLGRNGQLITGKIDSTGQIVLDEEPNQTVNLFYPVKLKFVDVPDDFLYYALQQVISKTSPLMDTLLKMEKVLTEVTADIVSMKGQDWTADFSIMRNHKDWVKESITPKGLAINVENGMVHATFSYNDHPSLSHFELEKWDEQTNAWVQQAAIPK